MGCCLESSEGIVCGGGFVRVWWDFGGWCELGGFCFLNVLS